MSVISNAYLCPMKKIITLILCTIVLFSPLSCKKKAADVNFKYVGVWYSDSSSNSEESYSLEIGSNSRAVYTKYKGAGEVTVSGFARVKGNKLKVLSKKFSIDQEPKEFPEGSGAYTMILDGITFTK